MPLVQRLRRWVAVSAIVFSLFVLGVYVRGRLRQRGDPRVIPGKIAYDIQRTASGFQYSKSEGGRTIFTIRAGDVKEFKLNGRAALHKVSIILYGKDSTRFDQISGDDFAYDPQSGDVTADGDVQIDLDANPAGLLSPDQALPTDLKSPIHLHTSGLVFNRNTGNANTNARVEFTAAQASGWAQGVRYEASSRMLSLSSQIHVVVAGADADAAVITAARGAVSGEPRQLLLEQVRVERGGSVLQAASATVMFGVDNRVERLVASGGIHGEVEPRENGGLQRSRTKVSAERAEFALNDAGNQLRSGLLTGQVRLEQSGGQPMQASAERVDLQFSGTGVIQKVKAEGQAHLHFGATEAESSAKPAAAGTITAGGGYEIAGQEVDFDVSGGGHLERAVTVGPARITLLSVLSGGSSLKEQTAGAKQSTVITAGRFEAKFGKAMQGGMRLASVHGEQEARIVSVAPGQPERVSTSRGVDAEFSPAGQLVAVTQQGDFHYFGGEGVGKQMEAFGDRARYVTADQVVTLTGNPRVTGQNMTTTAQTVRINRATGEALAQGDVKSTYVSQPEQGGGALLGSPSPVHVTAEAMKTKSQPTGAVYNGGVRLWQDANMIEAQEIDFDSTRRTVQATGGAGNSVATTLTQAGKDEKSTAVKITGARLTYVDGERVAVYEGGVTARGADFTATAKTIRVYFGSSGQVKTNQLVTGSSRVEKMVASGEIKIEQRGRKATGEEMVYTPAEEKFVLTGGPPSIFDAERGKITGGSLTFFRRDARVLVEGEASTPVVTQTRVAR